MIRLTRLTPEAFAPFGQVAQAGIGAVKTIRDGQVRLTRSAAQFAKTEAALDFALDFYEVSGSGANLAVTTAEQHPNSAQLFVPLQVERYLVLVWPQRPDPGVVPVAFVATAEQSVIYHPGVWHHGIVALQRDGVFASGMWRTRGGVDVEFMTLAQGFSLDLEQAVQ